MPHNVELKARLNSLSQAERVAERIATSRLGNERQTDTYFQVAHGRLKLREIERQPMDQSTVETQATLIWYQRPDTTATKLSDYRLLDVAEPQVLKEMLAGSIGMRCVVTKRRRIFLQGPVRIHLDDVAGLGTFIEFEAVLGPGYDESAGHEQVRLLCEQFGLDDAARIDVSYVDLLTA